MIYRRLGNTGMELSFISLGGSSLGSVFRKIHETEGLDTVFTAIENGINFIDTSPYYGHYTAETLLGKALKEIPRDRYYLATKVGRYGANGINTWDYSGKRVQSSILESMERLHIDYIDIIQVHDLEFSDIDQVVNETLPALVDARTKGQVGHIGITGLPLENFVKVIDRVPPGTVETVLTFCHYTLQDDSLLDYLDYFKRNNIAIINASPLSMGLLSERGIPSWHPASQKLQDTCSLAMQHCVRQGEPIEKLAVRYSVDHPAITTTLVGTANPANIRRNIQWSEESLNGDLVQEVQEILKPVHRETWLNC